MSASEWISYMLNTNKRWHHLTEPQWLSPGNSDWRDGLDHQAFIVNYTGVGIDLPIYSDATPKRTVYGLKVRGGDVDGAVGLATRAMSTTFVGCEFRDLEVGVDLVGANMNEFFGCHFIRCGTGVRLRRRDWDETKPGVGNDNRFHGCHFTQCKEAGFHSLWNDMHFGKSSGNGTEFLGCTFEGEADLLRVDSSLGVKVTGGRFELHGRHPGECHAIRVGKDGQGAAHHIHVTSSKIIVDNTNPDCTAYGMRVDAADVKDVQVWVTPFTVHENPGKIIKYEGPIKGYGNWAGINTMTAQGDRVVL